MLVLLLFCAAAALADEPARVAVWFSPHGGCEAEVIAEIAGARRDILVQAYSFTSKPIVAALIAAEKRGVDVRAVLDRGQRNPKISQSDELKASGAEVVFDGAHAIAHNKVMVIDEARVITGSFNFTESAEKRNAENLLVISSPSLARLYAANWAAHRKHSLP